MHPVESLVNTIADNVGWAVLAIYTIGFLSTIGIMVAVIVRALFF